MKNSGLLVLALLVLGCSSRFLESQPSTVVGESKANISASELKDPTLAQPSASKSAPSGSFSSEQVVSLAPVVRPIVKPTRTSRIEQTSIPPAVQSPLIEGDGASELGSLPPKENDWKFLRVRSKSNDGRITHVLLQQARINDHPKYPPVLGLRCKNQSLAVIVNFHEVLGSTSAELEFKFDDDESSQVNWNLTKLNDAAILHRAGPFIDSLLKARQLRVSIESMKGESFFAEFDLKGLDEELESFPTECTNILSAL